MWEEVLFLVTFYIKGKFLTCLEVLSDIVILALFLVILDLVILAYPSGHLVLSPCLELAWICNPPPPYCEAVYCFICGRRRVTVARYRMICLVFGYAPIVETRFPELAVSLFDFHLEYPPVLSRFRFNAFFIAFYVVKCLIYNYFL